MINLSESHSHALMRCNQVTFSCLLEPLAYNKTSSPYILNFPKLNLNATVKSNMNSNREESTTAYSSSEPVAKGAIGKDGRKVLPARDVESYVPNAFDLIMPTHRARDTVKSYIPPAFLQSEAVDSSLLLGRGASFTVTRQAVPAGPATIVEQMGMEGWSLETKTPPPKRPRHVVYKSARVEFQPNGQPLTRKDSQALQSVLTEFHALLHPELLKHPNIIDFLGLAWGTNHAHPLYRLPVLVVEYGDRGTLADVLRGPPLTNALKHELCLGIARGLEALHCNGIVHGDVKPENIIICSHKNKIMAPKLADFGFAFIEATEKSEVMIGGTPTWRAPESFSPIPVNKLKHTDVYSFGLVAWSLAIGGKDPFSLLISDSLSSNERLLEINRLKLEDQVLPMSKLEKWIFEWGFTKNLKSMYCYFETNSSRPTSESQSRTQESTNFDELRRLQELLSKILSVLKQVNSTNPSELLTPAITEFYRREPLYKDLDYLFSRTLTKDPALRDLSAVIKQLKGHEDVRLTKGVETLNNAESDDNSAASRREEYRIARMGESKDVMPTSTLVEVEDLKVASVSSKVNWFKQGFKFHRYSWQMTRDLDPSVQTFIAQRLLNLDDDDTPGLLVLAALFLNGYGVTSDEDQALDCLVKAAHRGHPIAQSCLYRMHKACQKEISPEIPILQYLKNQAIRGSRQAIIDLRELDPKEIEHIEYLIRFGYGGVGSNWYCDDQMLHGLTQSTLMSRDFRPETLGTKDNLADVIVNARGDKLIHASAAVGAYGLLKELLVNFKVHVDSLNQEGETALLCACRSGQPNCVKLLLDNGASASIQAANGETPLHWLVSFKDNINVAALGQDLIQKGGAIVDAFTTRHVSHSVFPGTIDIDFQAEGTPLMWAVHDNKPRIVSFLLSVGADPKWRIQKGATSPCESAAFYHHTECLKMIIEHLERVTDTPTTTEGKKDYRFAVFYGPLVRLAVHASDKFSMVLRNGTSYLDNLKSTLALLQEKTKFIRFELGQNETLLHFAAKEAHDEACKAILELGWLVDQINQPAGPSYRTPLLESVRWNRRALFQLLVQHGADPKALSSSPYDESGSRTWSALHVFADQAHNNDLTLVDDLIAAGVPVDGDHSVSPSIETPYHIAIRRNALRLADHLRSHGADPDATCVRSAFLVAPHPLTGLGHAIALNARHSVSGVRYMLAGSTSFIVEPTRNLSALHLAACVPEGFNYASGGAVARADFDWDTNRALVRQLLEWFQGPEKLDARCGSEGKAALHLAAEHGNFGVVEELVRAGADKLVRSEAGETAGEIAKRVWSGPETGEMVRKLLAWLE
ncbi:ankyrin [Hypoxylon sp. NC0597]|nr:ankyrin [Hypoxylon sp. NC0597]